MLHSAFPFDPLVPMPAATTDAALYCEALRNLLVLVEDDDALPEEIDDATDAARAVLDGRATECVWRCRSCGKTWTRERKPCPLCGARPALSGFV